MTGEESGPIGETSRRMFLRNGLLVSAGAAAVGVTSISLAGSAQAASAPAFRVRPTGLTELAPSAANARQSGWAWCSKCQGLWYSAGIITGHKIPCPAGGNHGGQKSYNYFLFYNYDIVQTNSQSGWAFCDSCSGLFYSNSNHGACPAFNGYVPHQIVASYDYTVFFYPYNITGGQEGWLWCAQCQGMFYGNRATRAGVCPLNGSVFSHNGDGSFPYQMLF